MDIKLAKKEVAYYMRRLYKRELTTCSGGNVSFRFSDNKVLITPSQIDKGTLRSKDIGVVSLDGKNLTPKFKLSMETQMHLSVYKSRPDIRAIVHAHPEFATSYAGSNLEINTSISGEARVLLGKPILAPYALMGSKDLAEIVGSAIKKGNVVVMENHGILTVGNNLFMAYNRMEVLESAAKISFITQLMGKRKELSDLRLKEIDNLFS